MPYHKKEMGGWDNIQGNWLWDDQLADYAGIRMSLKGPDGGRLKFVFNSNWGDATTPIIHVSSEWKEYTGNSGEYYFDNIGYVLKEE